MGFEELEALRRSLGEIRERQIASLRHYHDEPTNGFYHRLDERVVGDFSKSSTATCVLALVATENWQKVGGDKTKDLVVALLDSEWTSAGLEVNNVFTVAFVLEAVIALMGFAAAVLDEGGYRARIGEAERILETALKNGYAQIDPYGPSAYLTQLAMRALLASRIQTGKGAEAQDLGHVEEWAWREIDHQLALLVASSSYADLFQLAYSIMIVSTLGDPQKATPERNLILRGALAKLFEGQLPDGSWPRSRPLFHYPKVGSAYCYEYEMMAQLVQVPQLSPELLKYLPNFSRLVMRLKETAYPLGDDGLGWSSGHHPQFRGPESWSTASVFHFAHVLDRLVAEAIRRSIFEYLDTPYSVPLTPRAEERDFAPDFLDSVVYIGNEPHPLRRTIFQRFVNRLAKEASRVRLGGALSPDTPMSAIFFGPPGTSKTELTKYIADYLRWPRLVVDPSYFVRNGMDQVQAQADRLFDMMAASEELVVLMDEFDEMMRERSRATEVLSRFLTTAMLPKLANINKQRRIVFIVATNNIDYFDLAVSRRGRFDVILQIMPPTAEEKLRKWTNVAENLGRLNVNTASIREEIADLTFDEFRGIAPALEKADSAEQFTHIVAEAHETCTLNTYLDPQAKEKKNWKEVSNDQRAKNRVPFLPPA